MCTQILFDPRLDGAPEKARRPSKLEASHNIEQFDTSFGKILVRQQKDQ
jgi:hypothetical protein